MPYQKPGQQQTSKRAPRSTRIYGTVTSGLAEWSLSNGERCGLREDIMAEYNLSVGDNIRIRNEDNGVEAAFIVYYTHTTGSSIRMVKAGRDRFYAETVEDPTASTFNASFTPVVPNRGIFRESVANTEAECFETWDLDRNDSVILTAPHAGEMENNSGEIATRIANNIDTSLWTAEGYSNPESPKGAFAKWHLTSTQINRNAWDGLDEAARLGGWDIAVSIHGFSQPDIAVGGLVPLELRRSIASALNADAGVTANAIAVGPDGDDAGAYEQYWGNTPTNFVNWLTASGSGGIQIELPTLTRSDEWEAVARVLSDELAAL